MSQKLNSNSQAHTGLEEAELDELREAFDLFDRDGDKMIAA